MNISGHHWSLLAKAARKRRKDDFKEYFELKDLLAEKSPKAKQEFRKLFSQWYRLNNAGVTEAFKARYFELLFEAGPHGKEDPYSEILLNLYRFKRRRGDRSLQCSFASKLVGIHDESWPIYDKYVREFFGMGVPAAGSIAFRAAGFASNMRLIKQRYQEWCACPQFNGTVEPLYEKNPGLRACHPHRALDVLVWTVGAKGIK